MIKDLLTVRQVLPPGTYQSGSAVTGVPVDVSDFEGQMAFLQNVSLTQAGVLGHIETQVDGGAWHSIGTSGTFAEVTLKHSGTVQSLEVDSREAGQLVRYKSHFGGGGGGLMSIVVAGVPKNG